MPLTVKRRAWDPQAMVQAVAAIKEKKMGYLKASKTYNVPRSTLEDYVKHKTKDIQALLETKLGRKSVLGNDLETQLVKYCEVMEERFFGLKIQDIKQLAFQLAIKNNIEHPFPLSKGAAGKKWLRNFLKRHPTLSVRKPHSVSLSRAKGFTKEKVAAFFDMLLPELIKVGMNPTKVFNVDETGITVVQSRRAKVISVKGKKQVGTLSSQERGALMTLVTCMSASGIFIPPLIIFPRKNMKPELLDGCPPGTIAKCHPSGWIQVDIFTEWLKHFIEFVKPSPADPVVLILDGHYSHTRNLDLIVLGREHGVIIVCLPPHTTHKLQPMDVAFMSPFKNYYSQEIETWMCNHPFRAVTCYQIGDLMGKAYAKCATLQIAMSGFKKCGIIPFDKNKFKDYEFSVLDEGNSQVENDSTTNPNSLTSTSSTSVLIPPVPEPGSSSSFSPFDIRPPPTLPSHSNKPTRGRPTGKAAIVTSSPYKNSLEETRQQTEEKKHLVGKKNSVCLQNTGTLPNTQKSSCCKTLFSSKKRKHSRPIDNLSSSSDDEEVPIVSTDDDDSADEDCMYCNQPYKLDTCGEQWIRCISCLHWVHELCAGVEKNEWKKYVCDFCA